MVRDSRVPNAHAFQMNSNARIPRLWRGSLGMPYRIVVRGVVQCTGAWSHAGTASAVRARDQAHLETREVGPVRGRGRAGAP